MWKSQFQGLTRPSGRFEKRFSGKDLDQKEIIDVVDAAHKKQEKGVKKESTRRRGGEETVSLLGTSTTKELSAEEKETGKTLLLHAAAITPADLLCEPLVDETTQFRSVHFNEILDL